MAEFHPNDPTSLIGLRVSVPWNNDMTYVGEIVKYDRLKNEYMIRYDDGEVKQYRFVYRRHSHRDGRITYSIRKGENDNRMVTFWDEEV